MKDLIEKVTKECIHAYFAAEHCNIEPFGLSSQKSAFLFQACFPINHFPKHLSKINPFLPQPLKKIIIDPEDGLSRKIIKNPDGTVNFEYNPNQLYVFQYPLNMKRIIRHKKKDGLFSKPVSIDYVKDFCYKFTGGLCIYLTFTGADKNEDKTHVPDGEKDKRRDLNLPLLIGKREIIQEVTDCLKKSQRNIFDLFTQITFEKEKWAIEYLKDNSKELHLYDLCKKPNEIHFKFE